MNHPKKTTPTSPRKIIPWGITAVVIAVFLFLFIVAMKDGFAWKNLIDARVVDPTFELPKGQPGKRIADFELYDRNHKPVRLSQFASVDMIIVNLWFSGCEACKEEIPSLSEMDRRLSELGNVALITITTDEKWSDVTSFFPFGTNLRVLFDPTKAIVEKAFGTTKFPETFILDRNRQIVARFDGARVWHSKEMFKYLSKYL